MLVSSCDAPSAPEPAAPLTFSPALLVYARRAGSAEIERLADGARVRAGDALQVECIPAGWPYGVLASLDGGGRVTLHLPPSPSGSTRLPGEAILRVPSAFKLDDAPGFERFVWVVDREPLEVGPTLEAIRRAGRAGSPGVGGASASFVVRKEPSPR